jgi:hypothetical protein
VTYNITLLDIPETQKAASAACAAH